MRTESLVVLCFLAIGLLFVTCNMITMINNYRTISSLEGIVKVGFNQILDDHVMKTTDLKKSSGENGRRFHVALTATDTLYSKWQSRIMYYWYSKKKGLPGSDMGSFTRILHTGKEDNLMDEIPTFIVDPLPNGLDQGYVVLNRPWAFVQWLKKATIDEEYILMVEPDHLFLKPLPNLASGDYPVGYQFDYMKLKETSKAILRKFFPKENGPVTMIDPTGNSPVLIKKDLLEKIAPTWMNVSMRMKNDPEADHYFGWVLEMYGYAVASALHGVKHMLRKDFMIQTPFDEETRNIFMIHYTYGCVLNMKGKVTNNTNMGKWRFDKRSYILKPPPRNISLPPPGAPESVVTIVKMINEATANLPNWETM